ncbi:MAG: hypothetical protein HQL56_07110 [Magnetococcales bacterium]|nr:hypothetical protein [Magnetococcales bacterium]
MNTIPCQVRVARQDLMAMIRLARCLFRLARHPRYIALRQESMPRVAHGPGAGQALLMGYDFHLSPDGPRLIEVNTNAGGALLACRAQFGASFGKAPVRFRSALLQELSEAGLSPAHGPVRLLVMDENPPGQFLYEEMALAVDLFRQWGLEADCADPVALQADAEGVFWRGEPVHALYNRHCDFYLEEAALQGVRAAWLAGKVHLSPDPRAYGLLSDKRCLTVWSDAGVLQELGLSAEEAAWVAERVPKTVLMANMDAESLWRERRHWVFKPVQAYGSRGVVLGDSISRSRFQALDPATTLAQRFVPPTLTRQGEEVRKTDFRLFVWREKILGLAARIYRGQVTNFREPGSGYARVCLAR